MAAVMKETSALDSGRLEGTSQHCLSRQQWPAEALRSIEDFARTRRRRHVTFEGRTVRDRPVIFVLFTAR